MNLADTLTATTASSNKTEKDTLANTSTGDSDTTCSSTRNPYTGSLLRYILIEALCGISLITIIIAEIIILLCLVIQIRRKTVTVASTAAAGSTQRHEHHNNSKSKETPIFLHDSSRHQNSPTVFINDLPAKVSTGEGHTVQESQKTGGKFAKNPIYIYLEPAETNQTVPQRPIICKNNQAYIHLGPEDSEASVKEESIIKI